MAYNIPLWVIVVMCMTAGCLGSVTAKLYTDYVWRTECLAGGVGIIMPRGAKEPYFRLLSPGEISKRHVITQEILRPAP